MLCGWGCGGWLTSHVMRAHFTRCPNRPALPQVNSLDRRDSPKLYVGSAGLTLAILCFTIDGNAERFRR